MKRTRPFSRSVKRSTKNVSRTTFISSFVKQNSLSSGPGPSRRSGRSAHALRQKIEENKSKSSNRPRPSMSTILSHAGLSSGNDDGSSSGHEHNAPLSPPIILATTFERPPSGDYGEDGSIYSRSCNPTRKLLEEVVGRLESAFDDNSPEDVSAPTFAFSSGMAAVASLLFACESPVKLLIPRDVYHGVPTQLHAVMNDHGLTHAVVDMTDRANIYRGIRENVGSGGTLVVWVETPSNPLCQVTDIRAACDAVHDMRTQHENTRIVVVVDSTWAPPCITRPLSFGADAVLHSATKYLGGHSDVLMGVVSCSFLTENGQWLVDRLKAVQTSVGAVASPLECWLTLRGLRTLHLRVERQCETAMKLAEFLSGHKNVLKCHYPGLKRHPQHEVAKMQMVGIDNSILYGGMLSFEVESEAMAIAVAGAVRTIRRATSLGGTETLIEHRASIEPPERQTSPLGLLRLSVGLEEAKDLQHDLEIALEVASLVAVQ